MGSSRTNGPESFLLAGIGSPLIITGYVSFTRTICGARRPSPVSCSSIRSPV